MSVLGCGSVVRSPTSVTFSMSLVQVANIPATLVFYVPPHALATVLSDMLNVFQPSRRAVVARELTKLHEEFYRLGHTASKALLLQ